MEQLPHQYGDLGNQFEAHRQYLISQNIFNEEVFIRVVNNNLNATFQEIITEYETEYIIMITTPQQMNEANNDHPSNDDSSDDDNINIENNRNAANVE
jgi:hypothetical protein